MSPMPGKSSEERWELPHQVYKARKTNAPQASEERSFCWHNIGITIEKRLSPCGDKSKRSGKSHFSKALSENSRAVSTFSASLMKRILLFFAGAGTKFKPLHKRLFKAKSASKILKSSAALLRSAIMRLRLQRSWFDRSFPEITRTPIQYMIKGYFLCLRSAHTWFSHLMDD